MPSPKAILRDIADLGLDPTVSYVRIGNSQRLEHRHPHPPVVEAAPEPEKQVVWKDQSGNGNDLSSKPVTQPEVEVHSSPVENSDEAVKEDVQATSDVSQDEKVMADVVAPVVDVAPPVAPAVEVPAPAKKPVPPKKVKKEKERVEVAKTDEPVSE